MLISVAKIDLCAFVTEICRLVLITSRGNSMLEDEYDGGQRTDKLPRTVEGIHRQKLRHARTCPCVVLRRRQQSSG